ncbi:hypothetical protein [Larkinella terrae]|uniref:SD-repeat containing protein B domain-containing protein n=1 Tax=Larkinella terrae TaxID=2025311 RepID=A0A7K0ELF6_9BACT|nr:hypothetical protein [Larkinella terrae]MRS62657.1 hypothetical protein [Larkinella terrae]
MKKLIQIIFFLSLYNLYASTACGQILKAEIWRESIKTRIGTTYTNRLTISNGSTRIQSIRVAVLSEPAIELVSKIPENLTLNPGEITMIPLKGFINSQPDSLLNRITIRVDSDNGQPLLRTSFLVEVEETAQSSLSLYTPDETILLYSGDQVAQLPLRLVNHRSRRQKVAIEVASLPDGIDRSGFPILVALSPRQDTSVTLRVPPLRYWSTRTPYEFIVTVRDSTGSVLGNIVYRMAMATATKRYAGQNINSTDGYGVSAAVTKLSNNQWAREGRIWGRDSLGKSQIDFQIHYLDYVSDNFRQLQNSHISIQNDRTLVRLGSMYDYHEMPLLGRGLKVNLIRPDHQWTFWAVNTNPNWLNPLANTWSGNMVSFRYDQAIANSPGSLWSVSSSYYTQSATMRAGFLNFGSLQWHQSKRHSLELLGGQSVEFSRHAADRARTLGWAGQVNYAYHSTELNWLIRSYVSSPNYAGLQKGATLLQSQLIWQPSEETTLAARLNHIRYDQIWYASPSERFRRIFGNSIAEISLKRQLKYFTVGLRPFWYSQIDFTNPFSQRADSYRISTSISYQYGPRQHVDVSYDVGTFHDRTPTSNRPTLLSHRVLSSWTLGAFNLYGYWQKGAYYLSDLRTDQPNRSMVASVTPMVDFSLFNHRLMGSVGLNYLYDALSTGTRCLAVGRVRFDITPDLWVRAVGNATPYSQQADLAYSQYRLEVTKQFSQLKLNRRGQMRLSFFEDANANGIRDSNERWMDSLLVSVNNNSLLTNSKGTIVYRNLPPSTYTVSAVSVNQVGEPVQYTEKLTVGRTVNRMIPLQRTFRVKGQLHAQTKNYDHKPIEFSRFTLEVLRNDQAVLSTAPLPDGGFVFHMPPGDYTLRVHDYARLGQTVVQTVPFKLSQSGQHPELDLTIDASTRAVEIKRFGAK